MRILGADLREKNRVRLEEVVPLATPMLMYLEPTNACNIRCSFCPTSDIPLLKQVGRPMGIMKWELFEKIVADLKEFKQPLKMINFFKDGEPLVNKKYPEMIRVLRDAGVAEKIWSKTNGLLLGKEMNERLAESGLDMLGISVIAPNAEGYKKTADVKANYEKLVEDVTDLFHRKNRPQISVKMTNVGFTQADIDKYYKDFEGISDFITVDNPHGWSRVDLKDWTLGHKSDTYDGVPNVPKVVCPWTLYQMSVNWNGTVQPCNEDWSWVNIVGDASKDSLLDIWNGEDLFNFRIMQLEGRRSESTACATCSQMQSQVDDVDKYRDMIKDNLIKSRANLKIKA
jgi:radical SAM protein with 4Fe4S-binding SPASM domain